MLCLLPRSGSHWRQPDQEFLVRTQIVQKLSRRQAEQSNWPWRGWKTGSKATINHLSTPAVTRNRPVTTSATTIDNREICCGNSMSERRWPARQLGYLKVKCTSEAWHVHCTVYTFKFVYRVFPFRCLLGNQVKVSKCSRDADDMFYITQRSTHLRIDKTNLFSGAPGQASSSQSSVPKICQKCTNSANF